MKVRATLLAGICASAISFPAFAQEATEDDLENPNFGQNVIVVTAQRQAQSLQEVPIAVSAFDAEALEAQQIENASDLQLTLPNVSFTKSNFTASSFTIRGIGDLCVGVTCGSDGDPRQRIATFSARVCSSRSISISSAPKCCAVRKARCPGVTPRQAS